MKNRFEWAKGINCELGDRSLETMLFKEQRGKKE